MIITHTVPRKLGGRAVAIEPAIRAKDAVNPYQSPVDCESQAKEVGDTTRTAIVAFAILAAIAFALVALFVGIHYPTMM